MSLVDQFESVFRSAERRRYAYERVNVRSCLVVTDLPAAGAERYLAATRAFLVELGDDVAYRALTESDAQDVDALLRLVEDAEPDLVVSYRNVRFGTWRWPYSLGVYLNVLTRETTTPVVVLPNPHEHPALPFREAQTARVMVLTDHLTGDDRLVNYGARFTRPRGTLYLTHVEDDAVFARYMEVIGKLPSIDTETAREDIRARLLKEPSDYVESCREVLEEQAHLTLSVEPVVRMGHTLADYERLVREHDVDLLVFHTKDEDQLALHGKAYSLAVKLRETPILML
ncbi:MAG: hypothetical protein ACFCGT_25440 [Sandaracinaceae bacterium]